MKKLLKKVYRATLRNRFVIPLIELKPQNIVAYVGYIKDLLTYRNRSKERIRLWPVLGEKTSMTEIDPHYFYQGVWALGHIKNNEAESHVDVGSQAQFVGFLSRLKRVRFVDIRPLPVHLDNFENIKGSVLSLPFENDSVCSVSCLHVAEHIGLGRYGDPLDPQGTEKACRELVRILSIGGHLYFSLPIGKERVEFNAHRIHTPATIISYFNGLKLLEFSAIDDKGRYIRNADITTFDKANYSCGLFHFTKQ